MLTKFHDTIGVITAAELKELTGKIHSLQGRV